MTGDGIRGERCPTCGKLYYQRGTNVVRIAIFAALTAAFILVGILSANAQQPTCRGGQCQPQQIQLWKPAPRWAPWNWCNPNLIKLRRQVIYTPIQQQQQYQPQAPQQNVQVQEEQVGAEGSKKKIVKHYDASGKLVSEEEIYY